MSEETLLVSSPVADRCESRLPAEAMLSEYKVCISSCRVRLMSAFRDLSIHSSAVKSQVQARSRQR
ncbi:hypothetical protein HK11_06275 [Acetobacter sp. DmW_043]|nr:hypothetical protein HK11_06275 [Acetobacter sp. DmW_043]OUJ11733.1 hypothetical protein HK25_12995 [Acetobacter sp. DsW_059]